ncbi:cytochrome c maturation protein CcmE [Thermincola ferriacetica]
MKNKKALVVVGIAVIAVGLLISAGMQSAMGENMTVAQALAANSRGENPGFIQIESKVDNDTIKYDSTVPILKFELTDGKNRLPVVYRDVMPDNFESGYPVIVEGRFDEKGVLQADKLLVKCPSKYEEEKVAPGAAPGEKIKK